MQTFHDFRPTVFPVPNLVNNYKIKQCLFLNKNNLTTCAEFSHLWGYVCHAVIVDLVIPNDSWHSHLLL